jgi:acetyl esterase
VVHTLLVQGLPTVLRSAVHRVRRLPDDALRLTCGPPPKNDHGVTLDLRVHALLSLMRAAGADELGTVAQARRFQDRAARVVDVHPRRLPAVFEREIPGPLGPIPIRVYRGDTGGALPVLVYLHGGGFVLGGLDSHEGVCRMLADETRSVVVAAGYRLAPEHPYPAAVEDALAAFRWVRAHARSLGGRGPEAVAIAGDSAGANLSAVVCRRLRDAGEAPPLLQGLIYPCTDMRRVHPSHQTFAAGYFLTAAKLDWFIEHYLEAPASVEHPDASPLLAERLDELPPALVLTAGFDPLRDEGQAYAEALREAGVRVDDRCHQRLIHGFFSMGGIVPAARLAALNFADRLRVELHRLAEEAA